MDFPSGPSLPTSLRAIGNETDSNLLVNRSAKVSRKKPTTVCVVNDGVQHSIVLFPSFELDGKSHVEIPPHLPPSVSIISLDPSQAFHPVFSNTCTRCRRMGENRTIETRPILHRAFSETAMTVSGQASQSSRWLIECDRFAGTPYLHPLRKTRWHLISHFVNYIR